MYATPLESQALEFNRNEKFNHPLFRRAGELGLHGVTVDPDYGGAGMDATAACIIHEELSYSDPAFCLSYLAHSQECTAGPDKQRTASCALCSPKLVVSTHHPTPRIPSPDSPLVSLPSILATRLNALPQRHTPAAASTSRTLRPGC